MRYGLASAAAKARAAAIVLCMGAGAAVAQADDPIVIAAMGDSLTAGYGLPQGQGFVPQLQDWLEGAVEMPVTLLNAGVSGDTTAGGLARIEWTLTPEVDALIVALGGNDLLRGIPPEAARANLEGILQVAADRGLPVLLVGLEATSNYGADYKAAFDAMYPELAAEYGALYADNFLGGLLADGATAASAARFMQSDGIHPNAEGVALIVRDLGPEVAALAKTVAEGAPEG